MVGPAGVAEASNFNGIGWQTFESRSIDYQRLFRRVANRSWTRAVAVAICRKRELRPFSATRILPDPVKAAAASVAAKIADGLNMSSSTSQKNQAA
jgi:hypothetical protein